MRRLSAFGFGRIHGAHYTACTIRPGPTQFILCAADTAAPQTSRRSSVVQVSRLHRPATAQQHWFKNAHINWFRKNGGTRS